MVTMDSVKLGLCKYADAEIMNKVTGLNKLLMGVVIMDLPNRVDDIIDNYRSMMESMEIIDVNGHFDIDKAETLLVKSVNKYGDVDFSYKNLKMRLDADDIRTVASHIRSI